MKMGKTALLASIAMGLTGVVSVNTANTTTVSVSGDARSGLSVSNQAVKVIKRVTSSKLMEQNLGVAINRYRYQKYKWLTVVNKESFKQARRKQLAKRSFKKAKKQGKA